MQLPSSIQLQDLKPGFPVLQINHAKAKGSIALLGAHVMEWTPAGHQPVLFMSADAVFEEGSPIRGGIPVCWPWFGPREGLPGHGVVRTVFWDIAAASETTDGVKITLKLINSGTLAGWSHPFELFLDVSMGTELQVTLSMKHLGDKMVTVTGALHTYITVGAIEQTSVTGLDGTSYQDTLDNHAVKPQAGSVIFDREVDRVYSSSTPVTIVDQAWKRTIEVSKSGSEATVVWNPWIEKSKRLSDLPDEAYHHFLCIESANAGEDVVRLSPGQTHKLGTTIRVGV